MTDDPLAPYAGHEGTVGRVHATSEPWWPPRSTPRDGAPNIVVMMCDDLGYADAGCYGSEIPTPNVDRLAAEGVRYTDYHSYPMCSPTRAALLTGLEPHRAGIGHVVHSDPGFPGYAMELTHLAPTLPELLRDAGYQTLMVGKWHLTKDGEQNDAGDRSSWPCQRGFDRYYGVLDAFTNLHHPHRLVEDNHAVRTDQYPEGYYVTDDLTDRAISMVREAKGSDPTKPFFLYFSHIAVHAPLQAKADDIARHRGRYDDGWDAIRARRFERQRELGVLAEGTELSPRNTEEGSDVEPWDSLDDDERRLYARYMEVYAAMVDNVDQNLGRLRSALEEMGEWDNTLFIFTSDNGGSREGQARGTTAYFRTLHWEQLGLPQPFEEDLERIDEVGGPTTLSHYPRGWAMASNTPFRLYKINAHRGGHSVPLVVSWPAAGIGAGAVAGAGAGAGSGAGAGLGAGADRGGSRGGLRHQYVHVVDLMPTLLQAAGVERPDSWNGGAALPLRGGSVLDTLFDPDAVGHTGEVMVECEGHRGYRRDGWEAVARHAARTPFSEDRWELFDMARDPSQVHDLAEAHPELLEELRRAWELAAWEDQVFPLDEGTGLKFLVRPPWSELYERPVTLFPGDTTLERWRAQRLIMWRDCDITASVELAPGDMGVLFAHGDQGGGYSLYLDDTGELVAAHNGYGLEHEVRGPVVPPGAHELTLAIRAPGEEMWDLSLILDGATVASGTGFRALMAMAPFEGIDVGIDRRSPVSWSVYQRHGAFPFTGTLRHVRYQPGPPAPDAPTQYLDVLREWGRSFE